jgi:hypothetical protein
MAEDTPISALPGHVPGDRIPTQPEVHAVMTALIQAADEMLDAGDEILAALNDGETAIRNGSPARAIEIIRAAIGIQRKRIVAAEGTAMKVPPWLYCGPAAMRPLPIPEPPKPKDGDRKQNQD